MKAAASVFRLADRAPRRRARLVDVESIPVIDSPPPAKEPDLSAFIGRGQGPWQRKARSMNVGQSLILEYRQAHCFKSACTRMGYRVAWRSLAGDRVQVQIVSKPTGGPRDGNQA